MGEPVDAGALCVGRGAFCFLDGLEFRFLRATDGAAPAFRQVFEGRAIVDAMELVTHGWIVYISAYATDVLLHDRLAFTVASNAWSSRPSTIFPSRCERTRQSAALKAIGRPAVDNPLLYITHIIIHISLKPKSTHCCVSLSVERIQMPLLPKPFSPRMASGSVSVGASVTAGVCMMTSWAMRSPL